MRQDAVLNTLGGFQTFDLEPIDADRAREYLQAFRRLEARFYQERIGKKPPRRNLTLEAEVNL